MKITITEIAKKRISSGNVNSRSWSIMGLYSIKWQEKDGLIRESKIWYIGPRNAINPPSKSAAIENFLLGFCQCLPSTRCTGTGVILRCLVKLGFLKLFFRVQQLFPPEHGQNEFSMFEKSNFSRVICF